MMFPSLRGGNDNPGQIEGMYGEIDDILAAADYLAALPYVDPQRIYLGGHSTGGTLVLLTAAASNRFRAVFSFGPVTRAAVYGDEFIPANFRRLPAWEERSRAPIEWLSSIRSPTFVIEGRGFGGNDEELRALRAANTNSSMQFIEVLDAGHFSVLAPMNEIIARAILGRHRPNTVDRVQQCRDRSGVFDRGRGFSPAHRSCAVRPKKTCKRIIRLRHARLGWMVQPRSRASCSRILTSANARLSPKTRQAKALATPRSRSCRHIWKWPRRRRTGPQPSAGACSGASTG
jgi:pimeloyl-ACP methyl ester carboxylesterase